MTVARHLAVWRTAFALALAFAITMALLPKPPTLPLDRLGDKWEHVIAFATLAALAVPAFPAAPLRRIGERLSFLGALIEVMQAIPALNRDCDIRDWIADTLAVAVALATAALIRRNTTSRSIGALDDVEF